MRSWDAMPVAEGFSPPHVDARAVAPRAAVVRAVLASGADAEVIDLRPGAPEPLAERARRADADLGAGPDERAIRAAIDACTVDYPGATRAQVEGMLRGFLAQT